MRSKRLELLEAVQNQKPSTVTKQQKAVKNLKGSTTKPHSTSNLRKKEVVTDALGEGLSAAIVKKQRSSTKKLNVGLVDDPRADEIVTDAVGERLNVDVLENQRSSATVPCSAFVNGSSGNEVLTDAVGGTVNAVVTEKQKSSAVKPCSAFVKGRRKKVVTDSAMGERLNTVALEKQESLTITPRITFVSGRRKLVTDSVEKHSSSTTKPHVSFINRPRSNEIATDAVDKRLNTVATEKPSFSTRKPHNSFVAGQRANRIGTEAVAVDERLNALENQRSPATKSSCGIVNGSWANEIMNIAVDARLNAVADHALVDAGSNSGEEHADILDADEEGDVQIVEQQSLPNNSYEDADTLDTWSNLRDEDANVPDADGDNDIQFKEEPLLFTDSDEDPDILYGDGNGYNFEKVAVSSRKRAHDTVQRSTSRPTDNRKNIIFDIYGRPCDDGSVQFATDIGRAVRANCRPATESWRKVPNSTKDNIWKDVINKYVVSEVYRPNVLARAGTSFRIWKYQLRLEMDKYQTISDRKINMPEGLIRNRDDWESFVDFCNTEEDRKRREAGRKAREAMEFVSSAGRRGIYRKIYDLEKESPNGEFNRSAMFLDTHVPSTSNDPESSSISDIKLRLIKELVEANPDGQKDIDNDAVAQVCGRDKKGVVRGMGGGVSRTKVRASATVVETLRKVQQENKRLKSDTQLLLAKFGPSNQSVHQDYISTPSHQSASKAPDASNLPSRSSLTPPDLSNLPARSHLAPADMSDLRARSHLSPPASSSPARSRLVPPVSSSPARSRLAPPVCSSPARSQLAPPVSSSPAHSRLAPPVCNSPAHSRLAPPVCSSPARSQLAPVASNLAGSSCFIKNFKGKTIALGSFNTAEPPMEHVYSLIIENIFDRDAELFDKDGKLGDIMIGGVINWPKACVVANLPVDSCFIRNFKRRTIGFGTFSASADPQMEHVYRVVVKEVYDRDAELFDTDGKLGDVMVGGVINWPKACIKPC